MDHFGIGAAMRALATAYTYSARRTGRTTSLVESVKSGDRLVFTHGVEASRVKRMCLDRGVEVECIVVDPKRPQQVFDRGTPKGRTIFDHSWVEQWYLNAIDQAQKEVDELQREASGYGEAHQETRRRAEELARWNI